MRGFGRSRLSRQWWMRCGVLGDRWTIRRSLFCGCCNSVNWSDTYFFQKGAGNLNDESKKCILGESRVVASRYNLVYGWRKAAALRQRAGVWLDRQERVCRRGRRRQAARLKGCCRGGRGEGS